MIQDSVDIVLATYARLIQTLKKQIKDLEKSIVAFIGRKINLETLNGNVHL